MRERHSRPPAESDPGPPRQRWQTPRSRDGTLAWEQPTPWLRLRGILPVGALFRVVRCPTAGRPWAPAGVRSQLRHAADRGGVRRRFAPHQLRHAHAVEMSREGVPLLLIQRQLGARGLAITSVYLREIDSTEVVHAVHERPAPMTQPPTGCRPTCVLVGSPRTIHEARGIPSIAWRRPATLSSAPSPL
jgi:hypothetical protein